MSKAALKKELATFTREQLVDVVLNVYSASPEAKAYFEFFLNPDGAALMEKKLEAARKEADRTRYGYCKARVSVLRKLVKELEAFGVDQETVLTFVLEVFARLYVNSHYYYFTDTLVNGMCKFAAEAFIRGNKMGCAQETINKLVDVMALVTSTYTERIRNAIAEAANDARVLISFHK